MSLPVTSRQKSIPRPARLESDVSLQDKRRLLSYWKSLEPPTTPDQEPDDKGSVTDTLLEDFKKSLTEMEKCVSDVISSEIETNNLQSEQQSLLKQLRDYVQYLIKEKIVLDLNDNLNTGKDVNRDYQERFAAMEAERNSLLEENKKLVKQLETQSEEFKSSNQEQQRDIETLTREVQSFNISRRKLERELSQATKLKDENEATINSLRRELQTVKETYDTEIQKLSSINEQVSKDNSELVEKGKEATESLKVALQQLTEEKKALQDQKRSVSGKSISELENSLERAKKERETFRQRCEKSEMLQRNLHQEITSLRSQLKEKAEEVKSFSQNNEVATGKVKSIERSSSIGEDDLSTEKVLKSAQSRIAQLKNYVHVLEDRVKEREESILSLRNENARANDVAMEKSLELSRTRRILERKIEKLVKENSELKRKFLMPSSTTKTSNVGSEENKKVDVAAIQTKEKEQQLPQTIPNFDAEGTKQTKGGRVQDKHRRKSNPERSSIQTTLKGFKNVVQQHPVADNRSSREEETHTTANNEVSDDKSFIKGEQDSVFTSVEVRELDVTPRKRTGGKFVRASSKRHSADLGKLMSRQETAEARKLHSDQLDKDEPATIFVNKYRKTSEDGEHWV